MHVVTISATYGAGGALVGPEVADRLGVPFVDRAVPVAVANDLGITSTTRCPATSSAEGGCPAC